MQTTRFTCIDNLTALGHELREEHLALAAGGRMYRSTWTIYIDGVRFVLHDD